MLRKQLLLIYKMHCHKNIIVIIIYMVRHQTKRFKKIKRVQGQTGKTSRTKRVGGATGNADEEPKYPFILNIAYPDNKVSSVKQYYGYDTLKEIKKFVGKKVFNFLYDNLSGSTLYNKDKSCFNLGENCINVNEIKKFIEDDYYNEIAMRNDPIDARVFINNEWQYITPTYEEMYEYFVNDYNEKNKQEDDNGEDYTPSSDSEGVE